MTAQLPSDLLRALRDLLGRDGLLTDPAEYQKMSQAINPYGDGRASGRIVGALLHYFGASDRRPEEFNV